VHDTGVVTQGVRQGEGNRLGNLGNAYYSLGQGAEARQAGQQALRIYGKIKSPHAETVRRWLASLEGG
jgi:hypothetical protein